MLYVSKSATTTNRNMIQWQWGKNTQLLCVCFFLLWCVFMFILGKIGSNQMCRHKHVCRTWFLHFRLGHSNIPLISIELLPQPNRNPLQKFRLFSRSYFFLFLLLLPALIFFFLLLFYLDSLRIFFLLSFRFLLLHLPCSFSLSQPYAMFPLCDVNKNCAFITFSINSFPINGVKSWLTEKLSFK